MGLLSTLLKGRPNGVRARLFGTAKPTSPPPPSRPPPRAEAGEKALGLNKEAPKDVTPPDGYEVVLHKDALEEGRIIEVIVGGTAIAVAKVGGEHFAIANACPHAGGPLGEGSLDGHVVACPYHGWQFDIREGTCLTVPGQTVKRYDVKVVGTAVCVQL
jgi:nitrite reductase (NADH) small subunit